MKRLTIFTPTYNRAYILPKLYESLCDQTCQDFEWLVVDDGSTDDTQTLLQQWSEEGILDLRFVYQENGGKMRAYNRAVGMARGELFVCVDSDDILASETVVVDSLEFWNLHRQEKSEKPIAGMISFKSPIDGDRTFTDIKKKIEVKSSEDIFLEYSIEYTVFVSTEILRHYPYLVFDGEKFTTDVYIFYQMDEAYNFLVHPYFSQLFKYHDDGYTKHYRRLLFDNPKGYRELHSIRIKYKKKDYWKSVICYISISLFIGDHTMFSSSPNKWLTVLLFPIGVIKHLVDKYILSRLEK